jgi:hypothetical protein
MNNTDSIHNSPCASPNPIRSGALLAALLLVPLAALSQEASPSAAPVAAQQERRISGIALDKSVGARVGRDTSGRPVLLVNGKPAALNPGMLLWDAPEFTQVFGKAELDQMVVFVNLGTSHCEQPHVSRLNELPTFWKGHRDYDSSELERLLGSVLQVRPAAKLILWLRIGEYPDFTHMNPDAIIRNDQGDAAVVMSHFQRFEPYPAATPLKPTERYAVSFFSEAHRAEVGEMLESFVRAVEASPARDAVIGYLIGGGQDYQQYAWSPPDRSLANTPANWGDYSQAARRAFPQWLQRRYVGDLAALNRSWHSALSSFDEATPPPAAELAGYPAFHDPFREMRAYEWKRFLAEGRSEFIIGVADRIRATATRPLIIGTSGGDGGHRRDNTATGLLLRAPSLDFYLHQASYGVRIPPSVGGINAVLDSYGANGKLFLTDMDHRLWTQTRLGDVRISKAVSFNDDTVGHAHDMAMQRDMWRREYARLWVAGNHGAWYPSFAKPADYNHPEILAEMRFLHEQMRQVVNRNTTMANPGGHAEVAFVFDEEAVDFARSALAEFHAAGMITQWKESHASGVPIRYYYARDLRDGLIPPARLYVLQNLIHIDEIMAGRIKALHEAGATIVLLQGTGMAQLRAGRTDFLDETLGIKLRPMDTLAPALVKSGQTRSDSLHPLLSGDQWNTAATSLDTDRLKEVEGIALAVDDPRSTVLGVYQKSGLPAVASVAGTNGGKVVFIGAYSLSRGAISRLAAYAGAWRVAAPGNVVEADGEILMIHPLKDGKVEVVPKAPSALRQMPPGDISSPRAVEHTLNLKAGTTYLFKLHQ